MNETINEIKTLLYCALAHAPDENACTKEANEMFESIQALREKIEHFEECGGNIYNKDYDGPREP